MSNKLPTAKILVIRFSSIGDVVQALSIPAALALRFPNAEIHWITRKDLAPLLKNHPHIHKIWELDRKAGFIGLIQLARLMKTENFTHIYDAHNNARSRSVTFILRPWGFLGIGPALIRRSIRRWQRLLLFKFRINTFEMPFSGQRDLLEPLQSWGIEKQAPPAPQLFPSEDSSKKALEVLGSFAGGISLAPSAAYFLKRWPKSYWKELIQAFPEKKFILLGGPEDSFLEDIAAVAPNRVLNLAGRCTLPVSAAVVGLSKALISNDTGLLHIAEQLGQKAIALMGPAPFGFPSRPTTKILELNLKCRPCSKHGQGPCTNTIKYHECLVGITPQDVTKALNQLLGDLNS
jgi:ADP-heptose:LPS heptosyltransferase